MSLFALLLTLAAATLHASWNTILAERRNAPAATGIALLFGVLAALPFALASWDIRPAAVPFLVASAGLELSYFVLLGTAYRSSEMSLVYPLARGGAPVLTLLFGVSLLGATATGIQALGVLLVAGGVMLVRALRSSAPPRGVLIALLIACCISGYTLLDKQAIAHASPPAYLWAVLALPLGPYLGFVALRHGAASLRRELRPRVALAGAAMAAAYGLTLLALRIAPAAAVAAVRETSIVIAVVFAALWLRQPVSGQRLVGAAIVAAGVALVALGS